MKDDRLYLVDMLEISRRIQNRLNGVMRDDFDRNEDLQLAITHLLQKIGEAERLVSPPTRSTLPNIPWNHITGMRHRIVHDYLNIKYDVVWSTALAISDLINELAPVVDPFIASEKAKPGKDNP